MNLQPWTARFLQQAQHCRALGVGEFTLKSGRKSPYFFNAGRFCNGRALNVLAGCYYQALHAAGTGFDMLFGPAYKGIPLAAALACEIAERDGREMPFAYDRKEAKTHGEGGELIGAPLAGRVVIVDDVLSAGTSARQAIGRIRRAGATPAALLIGLDRQEAGLLQSASARTELETDGVRVIAVATLADMVEYIAGCKEFSSEEQFAIREYQRQWGADS